MPIDTKHPDYVKREPRWQLMRDSLGDQDMIKDGGTIYLPKTEGMTRNDYDEKAYSAYKMRARFPEVTSLSLTGIVGIIFEKEPEGANDVKITRDGQTNLELSREVVRAVTSYGRDILVVDAPIAGGVPFITRYSAQSMINWRVDDDDPSQLQLAVFEEEISAAKDDYGHETECVYRKYQRVEGRIEVSLWKIEDETDILLEGPITLPLPIMPVVVVGSINLNPKPDPLPLLPVARCAVAYYQKSANLEHAMHMVTQPTPTINGIDEKQYHEIADQGYGSSSIWFLGEKGVATFLQPNSDWGPLVSMMEWELKQAENYSVRITRDSGSAESGAALSIRASSQHASIYTISRTVSAGINEAEQLRRQWAADNSEYVDFELPTDFDPVVISEQMIAVLNAGVNSGTTPNSILWDAYRKAKLTELTDEEIQDEIETQAGPELDMDAFNRRMENEPKEPDDVTAEVPDDTG